MDAFYTFRRLRLAGIPTAALGAVEVPMVCDGDVWHLADCMHLDSAFRVLTPVRLDWGDPGPLCPRCRERTDRPLTFWPKSHLRQAEHVLDMQNRLSASEQYLSCGDAAHMRAGLAPGEFVPSAITEDFTFKASRLATLDRELRDDDEIGWIGLRDHVEQLLVRLECGPWAAYEEMRRMLQDTETRTWCMIAVSENARGAVGPAGSVGYMAALSGRSALLRYHAKKATFVVSPTMNLTQAGPWTRHMVVDLGDAPSCPEERDRLVETVNALLPEECDTDGRGCVAEALVRAGAVLV